MRFLRRNWTKASRLGKGRKKKQVWRSAKGRHTKTRNKRKGYPAIVEIGFRTEKKGRDLIQGKKPILVQNIQEIQQLKKGEVALLGKIGNKKKLEITKFAKEKGIIISNVNINKTLKKFEKKVENKK